MRIKKMTRKFFMPLFFLFIFILVNISFAEKNNVVKNETPFLFIQTGNQGEISYDKDNKFYLLSISKLDPGVIYFSNAPKRITDYITIKAFLEEVKKDLAANKKGLNAGIVAESHYKTVRFTVSLTDPYYDHVSGTMTYHAHMLPGFQDLPLPDNLQLQHVSLFIDGACASCGGGGF